MSFNKDEYIKIVREQLEKHKSITCQDIIKLCFQGGFGPGHLIKDRERIEEYFYNEFQETPEDDGEVCEVISQEYVRINIAPYKKAGLSPEWLFRMFLLTANEQEVPGIVLLNQHLMIIKELAEMGECPFSLEEWNKAQQEYLSNGGGAVHHSAKYRDAEKPSYRVVHKKYAKMIPLLKVMAEQQRLCKRASAIELEVDSRGDLIAVPKLDGRDAILVLAIEGRAASGKTTLAHQLKRITGASIIAMDHFFLPPVLRKPGRLREIGGNVHYERILEEVMPNLKEDKPFSYTMFDCSTMQPGRTIEVPVTSWRIVEGVYSMHPRLGDYADIKVFLDVDEDEQLRRISARNGKEMTKRFKEEWIPMEEAYFYNYKVQDKADLIYG